MKPETAPGPEDRLVMKATAGLLAGGQALTLAAHFAALFTVLGWWLSPSQTHPLIGLLWAGGLLLWSVQCWLGFRIAIDAVLFRSLDPSELPAFDTWLQGWGWSPPSAPRTPQQRGEGALKLLRRQGIVLLLQLLALVLGSAVKFLG